MDLESLGLTFLLRGSDNDPAGSAGRLEDIFRRLSFRLPRVLGSRPIAPGALLNSPGSADPLGSIIANAVIQNMLRGAPTADDPSVGRSTGAPPPRIVPGVMPPPTTPPTPGRVVPIEPPTVTRPPVGTRDRGSFRDDYSAVDQQLRRGTRRIV